MNILIGNTGLVGSALKESISFDYEYNSSNLEEISKVDTSEAILYLSCLPATKWKVNQNIEQDYNNIGKIVKTLSPLSFKTIILISTIDVYTNSETLIDESYAPVVDKLDYGSNRYLFELLIKQTVKYDRLYIFRLPALFHKNIKKNVLYDLIHNNNVDKIVTKSSYQWFNLSKLYETIMYLINRNITDAQVFNLFTPPIHTSDIVKLFPDKVDKVDNKSIGANYHWLTKYFESGYVLDMTEEEILNDIKELINELSD